MNITSLHQYWWIILKTVLLHFPGDDVPPHRECQAVLIFPSTVCFTRKVSFLFNSDRPPRLMGIIIIYTVRRSCYIRYVHLIFRLCLKMTVKYPINISSLNLMYHWGSTFHRVESFTRSLVTLVRVFSSLPKSWTQFTSFIFPMNNFIIRFLLVLLSSLRIWNLPFIWPRWCFPSNWLIIIIVRDYIMLCFRAVGKFCMKLS